MLDELRNIFLAALLHSDVHSAIKLIDDWNAECERIQKIFDSMTDKNTVKEVEWVKRDNGQFFMYVCPVCGKDGTSENAAYDNYCSGCGSKMRKIQ